MPKQSVLFLLAFCAACATSGTAGGRSSSCRNPGGDESLPRTISSEDLAAMGVSNAREAVDKLRPDLLEPPQFTPYPGGAAIGFSRVIGMELGVYLDGELLGGPEKLTEVPVETIKEMEWLNRCEALVRFHGPHPKGALLITTTARSGFDHP